MQVCGSAGSEGLQASIPVLLQALSSANSQQVRGSALAALAAVLLACRDAALPLLPCLVPALMAAAQAALSLLPSSDTPGAGEKHATLDLEFVLQMTCRLMLQLSCYGACGRAHTHVRISADMLSKFPNLPCDNTMLPCRRSRAGGGQRRR